VVAAPRPYGVAPEKILNTSLTLPFEDSRRLTGANLFFASTGAVLETHGIEPDEGLLSGWGARVERVRAKLGWSARGVVARRHRTGASLALAAAPDQLFAATEVNEWALCATLVERHPDVWNTRELEAALLAAALDNASDPQSVIPPVLAEAAALARLEQLAARERLPNLAPLLSATDARNLPYVLDDDTLTLGAGAKSRSYPAADLPPADGIPWAELSDIPTAIVTGSNGKTTTVRLIASCARAHGHHVAYCSTEGVFVDGKAVQLGDYSGPAGARSVMRNPRTEAAVLETARGGILRRGIAISRAHVAVVTNISADHFGEYGIDDLDALADVKMTVGAVVAPDGLLVLNAQDPQLVSRAGVLAARYGRSPPLGWFALDYDQAILREHRTWGGSVCGVRGGQLMLSHRDVESEMGDIMTLPLTVSGSATYNVANLAAAALAAVALGIPARTVADVLSRFGSDPADNPGRLMRFEVNGVRIIIDYAHNPEGLRGLLNVAEHLRAGRGRLGLLLGHAGNRRDADIEALARVAAEFRPDLIVVKENESHLRGREPGEIPRIIRSALLKLGFSDEALPVRLTELDAARCALDWARPADVLALPIHSPSARTAVLSLLQQTTR